MALCRKVHGKGFRGELGLLKPHGDGVTLPDVSPVRMGLRGKRKGISVCKGGGKAQVPAERRCIHHPNCLAIDAPGDLGDTTLVYKRYKNG